MNIDDSINDSSAVSTETPLFTRQISYDTYKFVDKKFSPIFKKWKKKTGKAEIPLKDLKDELEKYVEKNGIAQTVKEELEYIFEKADRNVNKSIDFEEFKKMLLNRINPLDKQKTEITVKILESIVNRFACESDKKEIDISIKKLLKFPPPIFIISISIAQIALFIYNLMDCDSDMDLVQKKVFSGVLIFNPNKKNEVWRLITHLFVYTGKVHFIKNIIFQIIIGIILELLNHLIDYKYKLTRFLIPLAFLCGVLTVKFVNIFKGALGTCAINPNVYIGGSSAGIFSICMVYCIYCYKNFGDMKFSFPIIVPFAAQVLVEVATLMLASESEKLSSWCHIFGIVSGLLVGTCVIREKTGNRYSLRAIFGFIAHLILLLILFICYLQ